MGFIKIFHRKKYFLKRLFLRKTYNYLSFEEYREIFKFMPRIADCCALMTRDEAEACTRLTKELGLPSHHDTQKNWDTLKSLFYIITAIDVSSPLLDAGCGERSTILNWLALLGYQHLYACDIRPVREQSYRSEQIKFSVQNLTHTCYPDRFFHAVTCISVIEHGVDLHNFFKEMSRIIKREGLLIISTDYWSKPIDCSCIYPYGKEMGEMKVFGPEQIQAIISLANSNGFSLCRPIDLKTYERAVRWERVQREYTFIFFALKKTLD